MRSRPNTIGFRKIQFHRGNPESPAYQEYSRAVDKDNDADKRMDDQRIHEHVDKENEDQMEASLEPNTVE